MQTRPTAVAGSFSIVLPIVIFRVSGVLGLEPSRAHGVIRFSYFSFFSFEDVQTRPSRGQSSGGGARIDGYELDAKYPYSCFLASSFLLVRSYLAGGMRLAYQQSAGSLTSFCSCSGLGGFGLGSHVEWLVGWLWGVSERTWRQRGLTILPLAIGPRCVLN